MSINEDIGVIFSEKNYLPKDISEKQKYKAWIIKNNISYTIYHFLIGLVYSYFSYLNQNIKKNYLSTRRFAN